jgi:hypothetical protein
MTRARRLLWIAPLAIIGFAAFITLGGWVVMSLWNWLLPELFGWKTLTFWQALGLLLLTRILFGGTGRGMMRPGRHGGHGPWRGGMAFKWSRMSDTEREAFREKMRDRWGHDDGAPV